MQDYNKQASNYWWMVAIVGFALLANALHSLLALPATTFLQVVLAMVFVGAVAFFPVRVPGTKLSIAAGEIVIFLVLLLFGVEAAAVIAALEGMTASARTSKRWTSWFGTPAMAVIAVSSSGYLFFAAREAMERNGLLNGATTLLLLTLFAVVYCALGNILPSLLLALKRDERLNVFSLLKDRSWMMAAHVCSAAIAGLLFVAGATIDVWVLLATLPPIAISLLCAHALLEHFGVKQHS